MKIEGACHPVISECPLMVCFFLFCHYLHRASEGKTVEVTYRGDVHVTMKDILGGLRSACTYVGAAKLKELSRRTTFIRVTQQTNNIFGTST